MIRFFIFILIFFAVTVEAQTDCVCSKQGNKIQDFSDSELVFRGKVEKIIWFNTSDYVVEARIIESWKGIQSSGSVWIPSSLSNMGVDYDFVLGNEYLIYANENREDSLFVNKHGPTVPWSKIIEEDLIMLGGPAYEEPQE